MVVLNMIDTLGSGIPRSFRIQRTRGFPLPDFDLDAGQRVVVTLLGAKTARRDAEADLECRERAEAHRLRALPGLADRLAEACFTYAEHAEGRVMVRDQLAQALLAVLLKSGLHRDPRFERPPD
jgi:hypothetical protein